MSDPISKTATFIQGAVLKPMVADGIGAGDIVRAGKADDLALALYLLKQSLDLAQRAGASLGEISRIRGLAGRLVQRT